MRAYAVYGPKLSNSAHVCNRSVMAGFAASGLLELFLSTMLEIQTNDILQIPVRIQLKPLGNELLQRV